MWKVRSRLDRLDRGARCSGDRSMSVSVRPDAPSRLVLVPHYPRCSRPLQVPCSVQVSYSAPDSPGFQRQSCVRLLVLRSVPPAAELCWLLGPAPVPAAELCWLVGPAPVPAAELCWLLGPAPRPTSGRAMLACWSCAPSHQRQSCVGLLVLRPVPPAAELCWLLGPAPVPAARVAGFPAPSMLISISCIAH